MRMFAATLALAVVPSLAIADDRASALDAWKGCLLEKASAFATLDASLTEVVEASAGACLEQRTAFQDLQKEHHQALGADLGRAVQLANEITVDTEALFLREAMSVVAETRASH